MFLSAHRLCCFLVVVLLLIFSTCSPVSATSSPIRIHCTCNRMSVLYSPICLYLHYMYNLFCVHHFFRVVLFRSLSVIMSIWCCTSINFFVHYLDDGWWNWLGWAGLSCCSYTLNEPFHLKGL